MLSHLHIENFALIDELDISFGEGLNILTGATGAGKSIIIGALDLILGGRGSEEIIRTGAPLCVVEGRFKVADTGLTRYLKNELEITIEDDTLVIRREYRRKGGGRAFIENSLVPLATLKQVAENLADILGQHSHQALLDPATHSGYLDRYSGLEGQVGELRALYNQTIGLREELAVADRRAREISDRIELLTFQVREIDGAALRSGEEEKLKDEKRLLENALKIREVSNLVIVALLEDDGSAIERIGEAEKSLGSIAAASDTVRKIIDAIISSSDSLREAVIDLKNFSERLDDDPGRLEEVGERLDEIFRLKKKYGANIDEILSFAVNSRAELEALKYRQLDNRSLKDRFEKSLAEMSALAIKISAARQKARPALEKLMVEKLALMGIPKAQFVIEMTVAESDNGLYSVDGKKFAGDTTGFDIVEFQFCANPGEGLKPLARVASGGEISRVMLALKNAFLRARGGACEVFDEIDVGISGDVAAKVGRQLKELSRKHQVICITHLAQIASQADLHFRVFKSSQKGRSVTRVEPLDREARVKEIASLLSGEKVSLKAIAGAEELLKNAGKDRP